MRTLRPCAGGLRDCQWSLDSHSIVAACLGDCIATMNVESTTIVHVSYIFYLYFSLLYIYLLVCFLIELLTFSSYLDTLDLSPLISSNSSIIVYIYIYISIPLFFSSSPSHCKYFTLLETATHRQRNGCAVASHRIAAHTHWLCTRGTVCVGP